jgi:hypothetical protein
MRGKSLECTLFVALLLSFAGILSLEPVYAENCWRWTTMVVHMEEVAE